MKRYTSIFLMIYVFSIGTTIAMDGLTPEQEVLYQAIVQEVRCLVCQNQSIAESNAELAKDLRVEISNQIKEGKTEQEIKVFLLNRYGDFVLYQPSFNKKTLFLWLSPLILLFLIYGWYRKINLN
ncbi:MAG: cytochrome C biogenesis protein CcmH [Gammaproteobacteria bacterium]|nr:cytochrome C biogenesis protein CcmH [Gammaproteobacteria bacterium]